MENFDTVYTIWDHPIVKSLVFRYWQKFLIKKLPMKERSRTHWTVLRTVSMNFFFCLSASFTLSGKNIFTVFIVVIVAIISLVTAPAGTCVSFMRSIVFPHQLGVAVSHFQLSMSI